MAQQRIDILNKMLMCSLCRVNTPWLINLNQRPDLERDIVEFIGVPRYETGRITRYACPYCLDKIRIALTRKRQFLSAEFAIIQFVEQGINASPNNIDGVLPPIPYPGTQFYGTLPTATFPNTQTTTFPNSVLPAALRSLTPLQTSQPLKRTKNIKKNEPKLKRSRPSGTPKTIHTRQSKTKTKTQINVQSCEPANTSLPPENNSVVRSPRHNWTKEAGPLDTISHTNTTRNPESEHQPSELEAFDAFLASHHYYNQQTQENRRTPSNPNIMRYTSL